MKKISRRVVGITLALLLVICAILPFNANAASKYPLNDGAIINSYNVSSNMVTLYVGNVSVDGKSQLKYLYSDKSVDTSTLSQIKEILTSDYVSLLPTTEGQIAVSNDGSTVDDTFTDASKVVASRYSGNVEDTSSTLLYNADNYNALVTASKSEVSEEQTAEADNLTQYNARKTAWDTAEKQKEEIDPTYTPVDFPEEFVKAFNDDTSYPADYFINDSVKKDNTIYIIRNGVITQVDNYNINRTIVRVVNTSANVITKEAANSSSNNTGTTGTAIGNGTSNGSSTSTTTKLSTSPKTSDNLPLWIGIITVSIAVVTGTVVYTKKRTK